MSLRRRLWALDAKVIRSVRHPDEPAEAYLRRIAAFRRGFGIGDVAAVHQALREYFAEVDNSAPE